MLIHQAPGVERTDLQQLDAPGRELVQGRVDIQPKAGGAGSTEAFFEAYLIG